MGSGYFGEPNLGNERSAGGGGTSSRKSKKSNSDKPKQPQRGLGVAQLEKIRLHSQMGTCNYHHLPSFHNNPYNSPNLTTHQEDVRLQTGYSSSSSFSYSTPSSTSYGFPGHQGIVMGLSDSERANLRYGDAQPAACSTRWTPAGANGFLDAQQFTQPSMTRQLLDLQVLDDDDQEDTLEKRRRKDESDHHHNSESSGQQDLDLELRLSL